MDRAPIRHAVACALLLLLLFPGVPAVDSVLAAKQEEPDPGMPVAGQSPSRESDPVSGAIGFYQKYISSLRHGHCQFAPSCSEYAARAIAHYGVIEGTARAADRLMRCNAAARGIYRRGPDGRLLDAAAGRSPNRQAPTVPAWLVPDLDFDPPDSPAVEPDDETISFARALSNRRDCYRATTEYLRAAHRGGTAEWHAWAHMQSGACSFERGIWPESEKAFLEAGMLAPNGRWEMAGGYMAAACRFNAGQYATSLKLLEGPLVDGGKGGTVGSRSQVLGGLCHLAMGDWDKARTRLEKGLLQTTDRTESARIRFLADRSGEGRDLAGKSVSLATGLSAVLPGSGQIYSGRPADGLRHLIFNGALIYTVVKLAQDEHYPAAYLVTGVGLPFYIGNVLGAGSSANHYNRDRRLQFTRDAIEEAGLR